ncbi:WD40-repeat-containing domain protein [Circinella umbellata]|nr:WD40-repeat-containing domain protein [Circinella umbellata]
MVRINFADLDKRIHLSQTGRRMPYLCSVNEALGWRILSEGITKTAKTLRTNCFDLYNEDKHLTSLAQSDKNKGIIVMGSAYRQSDGYYNLYFIKDLMAPNNIIIDGPRFELVHTEKLDIPIYSLDWSGTHLLVGSKQGITRLYTVRGKFNELYQDQVENEYKVTQAAEYAIPISSVYDAPLLPDKYPMNSIIKSVDFNSSYSDDRVYKLWEPSIDNIENDEQEQKENIHITTNFLTTFMNQLNIWDALEEGNPKVSFNLGTNLINCGNWSPHAPHTLIATGGCDKTLRVIDVRTKEGVVWQAEEAHNRPIRDAKFNTFIPYWLASSGEDAIVNIYDIRASYHAPVARIAGHDGIVESITWSNMRCEILSTASSDGTMRLWIFKADAIPIFDSLYHTAKWSKRDTPVSSLRPQSKALWHSWQQSTIEEPWSKADQHIYYSDNDDPWGHSEDYGAETMLLTGALGIGEWGRSDKGPVYIGEDVEKSKGCVVKVSTSKSIAGEYYSITDRGQLISQTVRLENKQDAFVFPFRFKKENDPLANQIECDIFTRHIDRAKENIEKLRHVNCDIESVRDEQVAYFEDCMRVLPPIMPDQWGIDTIPDKMDRRISRRLWNQDDLWEVGISTFRKDLDYWGACRLPPGYATRNDFDLNIKERTLAPSTPTIKKSSEDSGISSTPIEDKQQQRPPIEEMSSNSHESLTKENTDRLLKTPSDTSITSSTSSRTSHNYSINSASNTNRQRGDNEIQKPQPKNPFYSVNADEGDPNISSPTMVFDMPEKQAQKLQQSSSSNLRSRSGTLRKNFNTSFLNRTSSRGSSFVSKISNNNNPFLQQQQQEEEPSQQSHQEEKQQQQQQQQQLETGKAVEQQQQQHRFGKSTQSLKRMFSRKAKQQQGPPPTEPYKRMTEQEENSAVNEMPEPSARQKRTIRRNAVFGAS